MADVAGNDTLTELMIAKMLEDDMRQLQNARAAEAIQLGEALRASALAAGGRIPTQIQPVPLWRSDQDVALQAFICEVVANKDAVLAQALQHAEEKNIVASLQYAQKLAAAEKKSALDAEFAKCLQQAIDNGEDETDMRDAERLVWCRESPLVTTQLAAVVAFSGSALSKTSWWGHFPSIDVLVFLSLSEYDLRRKT